MGATTDAVSTALRTPRLLELLALGHSAPPDAPLLISGEPGVGKDTLARLVRAANSAEIRGDVWEELRRLGAVELRVPPLRERPDEIVAFASFFMDRHNRGLRRQARLRPDVLGAYQTDSWPANLRQLEEAVLQQLVARRAPVRGMNPRRRGRNLLHRTRRLCVL